MDCRDCINEWVDLLLKDDANVCSDVNGDRSDNQSLLQLSIGDNITKSNNCTKVGTSSEWSGDFKPQNLRLTAVILALDNPSHDSPRHASRATSLFLTS